MWAFCRTGCVWQGGENAVLGHYDITRIEVGLMHHSNDNSLVAKAMMGLPLAFKPRYASSQ